MEIERPLLVHGIWHVPEGEAPPSEPIIVRAWMEYTVQHVITVMRDEDLLEVRRATIEWNMGRPVVTSNICSSIPMGTVTVIADEWRDEVGA